jgi:pSer/pThr/pTyr-binding forkhead associated (FHA) protein
MITCPVCRHQEYEGELFCTHCGAQLLIGEDSPITRSFSKAQLMEQTPASTKPAPARPAPRPPSPGQIALAVDGAEASIILADKFEYALGRESQGQVPPEVDLNPYGGREKGVSRRHALLRVDGRQLLLMDLNSANGTKLNGESLRAQEPVRLLDGDEIRMGKLVMHIYFNL